MYTKTRPVPYAPRNVLNAQALKEGIRARSLARGDSDDVMAWLLNHFWRHLVANFEPARTIETLTQARETWGNDALPQWVMQRLSASQAKRENHSRPPLFWVDPHDPQVLMLETRLVEFLVSRVGTALEGKLQRINCPQALELWEREHAEMAERIERGWRQSNEEAFRTLLHTEQGQFVELLPDTPYLREEMAFESYVMRHCLGQFANKQTLTGGYGEGYAKAIEARSTRLLSFRDPQGQPHITIGVNVDEDGTLSVEQVKGKQNRPPVERYVADVIACLNYLKTDGRIAPDCIAIGVVHTAQGWQRIEEVTQAEEQTRLIAQYPNLYVRLAAPTPMVQWLVAARDPNSLSEPHSLSSALRYSLQLSAVSNNRDKHNIESAPVFMVEDIPWPDLSDFLDDRRRQA